MGKRIYMDEDMTESYGSIHEASEAFLSHISLENMTLDTELQLEFGFDNDDLFSTQAMEAISDTVKNMASKAKSNFVTYAKKLINFLFGWLINFFKGATNVKKAMRSSYEKARTYLKKLNEYESKARSASKESNIEITDYGNCVVVGLFMIQIVILSVEQLSSRLKNLSEGKTPNGQDSTDLQTPNETKRAINMLNLLLSIVSIMYASVGIITISNSKNIVSSLRASQWDVSKIYNLASDAGIEAYFQAMGQVKSELNLKSADQDKVDTLISEFINKNASQFKSRMEETSKYIQDPAKAEMSYTKAFDELRSKLMIFVDISKANKWDFEKHISAVEKIRRGLEKEVSNMNANEENEEYISKLLKHIVAVGNAVGQVQKSMSETTGAVSRCIDGMTTDVAKLISKLTTISQG